MQSGQPFKEQAPEQLGQDFHRQKEAWAAVDPAANIARQPAPWHDDMHMRVMRLSDVSTNGTV